MQLGGANIFKKKIVETFNLKTINGFLKLPVGQILNGELKSDTTVYVEYFLD